MKFSAVIFLILFCAFSVFAQTQAEVIVTSTFLRKSPDAAAEKIQTVVKGDKLNFEKSRDTNGWYFVSTADGKVKGWIRTDTVRSTGKIKIVAPPKTEKINAPNEQKTEKIAAPKKQETNSTPKPILAQTPAVSPSPVVAPSPMTTETPVEDDEVLRVDTAEISLNVRVINNNNRPVSNLKQEQFQVYEDDVQQPIVSFTTAEVPIINALVIDNSRSLRSQLGKIIEAGKIIVGTNRPKDESTIVRFISRDKIEVVQDFTPKKNLLDDALTNLFVEGGQTAIVDAVFQTAKKIEQYQNSDKKEDVKLRSLILVSDGDDRDSVIKEQQLFDLLRQSNVQIYAVGFVSNLSKEIDATGTSRQEKARAFLSRIAQETGGKVYFPDSIDELPQIASDISGELHTQYLLSYSPTNENRDGSFHKIKVVVSDGENKEKRTAITRTGRTSAP